MSDTIYTETDQGALDFTHEVLTDINNFLCRTDGRPADLDLEKECVHLVEDILSAALRHGLRLHPSTVARVVMRSELSSAAVSQRYVATADGVLERQR